MELGSLFPMDGLVPSLPVGGGGLASWLFPQAGSAPLGAGGGGVEIWRRGASLPGGSGGPAKRCQGGGEPPCQEGAQGWLSFCRGPEPSAPLC